MKKILPACALMLLTTVVLAKKPTTGPVTDSILGFASTAPTSQPEAAAGAKPFKTEATGDRVGTLTDGNGKTFKGKITTTAEKPLRVWVEAEKDYEDVPIEQVASIQVHMVWERTEKEWNFKESGSDIKVYSGKTYPARETAYKFTLTDGTVIDGGIVAPLYVTTDDGKSQQFVLYKRDKGKIGQTLADLPYVKSVVFEK